MNVTTDPRLLKQMLLTQWLTESNPLSKTEENGAMGSSGLFSLLLSQYTADATQGASVTSVSSLGQPSSLSAGSAYLSAALAGALTNDVGSSAAYDDLISAAGAKYGVDPALIKGIIQSESSFNPNAVSSAGAKGLMQLMDETARGLGVTDSFDPAQNIDGGTRFLSFLLRKYDGNVSAALAAYNAGPGRVDRLGIRNDQDVERQYHQLPSETQGYIRKVLNATGLWSV